ncbi:MAG: hypothetical protein ACOYMP_03880 [Nodosilinea sp.]
MIIAAFSTRKIPAGVALIPLLGGVWSSLPPRSSPSADPNPQSLTAILSSPTLPPWPLTVPTPIDPQVSGITGLSPKPEDDLGIGHLQPLDRSSLQAENWTLSPLLYARWLRQVAIPLYAEPGESPWGWLIRGWLMIEGQSPIAIGRDASFAMVQADSGLYSFPVLEMRPDGWFRFRYTAAGTAWAHLNHLQGNTLALTVEPWADQLRRSARVQFRRPGLSQGLRMDPGEFSPLRSLVTSDSLIEPLEVEGNWVRVRVTQPAQGCLPLPGSNREEGWLRWRDDNQRLLVWFGLEANCS